VLKVYSCSHYWYWITIQS